MIHDCPEYCLLLQKRDREVGYELEYSNTKTVRPGHIDNFIVDAWIGSERERTRPLLV